MATERPHGVIALLERTKRQWFGSAHSRNSKYACDCVKEYEHPIDFVTLKRFRGLVSPRYQSEIGQNWVENPHNNPALAELKELISLTANRNDKTNLAKAWVTNPANTPTLADIKELMELAGDKNKGFKSWVGIVGGRQYKTQIAEIWIKRPDNPVAFADLKKLVGLVTDNNYRILKEHIGAVAKKEYERKIFSAWMEIPENIPSFEQITELMGLVRSKTSKGLIANKGMNKLDSAVSFDEMKALIEAVDSDSKSIIAEKWMVNEENNCSLENFKNLIGLLAENSRSITAGLWMKKAENNVSFEECKALMGLLPEKNRTVIASSWINKTGKNVSFAECKTLLELLPENNRAAIAILWIEKTGNNVSLEECKTLMELAPEGDRHLIASSWINKTGKNVSFAECKTLLELLPENNRAAIAILWMKKAENNVSLEECKTLRGLVPEHDRADITIAWINNISKTEEEKLQHLVTATDADLLGSKYNYDTIVDGYQKLVIPHDKIRELCGTLYPGNERVQAELFATFINNQVLQQAHLSTIQTFVQSMHEDDVALGVLRTASHKKIVTEENILEIASGRLSIKYQSVKGALEGKSAEDSLTPEGMETIKKLFGEEAPQIPLASLFSYYDIKGQIEEFASLVKPEVMDILKGEFKPTNSEAYIDVQEYKKLQRVFEVTLPGTSVLSDYLQPRVPPIALLSAEGINNCTIHFTGATSVSPSIVASNKEQDRMLIHFKKLLRHNSPSAEEVATFFNEMFDLGALLEGKNARGDDKKTLLQQGFVANKKEIVYLFGQEGGLNKFLVCLHSLEHGCGTNFGTNIQKAVIGSLITNPIDQVLYSAFSQNIVDLLINSGGDQLGSSVTGINVFDYARKSESVISPAGLAQKIYDSLLQEEGTTEAIAQKKTLNVLKKVPAVFDNPYLEPFKQQRSGASSSKAVPFSTMQGTEEISSQRMIPAPVQIAVIASKS